MDCAESTPTEQMRALFGMVLYSITLLCPGLSLTLRDVREIAVLFLKGHIPKITEGTFRVTSFLKRKM